jgi:SAM-dependent methyltransferase
MAASRERCWTPSPTGAILCAFRARLSRAGFEGAPMFAQSHAYEPFMGRWSRRLAPLFVEFAGVQDGEAVLDVGAGTGAVAAAILEARPKAHVTGLDVAPDYIAAARQQARRRARFVIGDAQALDFADGTFDRTVSMLALNFLRDPGRALAEQIRVTRPGGLIAGAVWDYGEGMQMLRAFWNEAVAADAFAEARDERHMRLCRHGELSALWLAHGMLAVGELPLTITQPFASFDDYWTPFLGGQGPAGAYVAALTPAKRTVLCDRLRALLVGSTDGPFTLTARAWAVKGYAPPAGDAGR